MSTKNPQDGDLRVWWVPQVPMTAFEVDVPDLKTASIILDTLAHYDAFQFEHKVKGDYCNTGGLQQYDGEAGEWWDWECSLTCDSFDEVRANPLLLAQAEEARSAKAGAA